MRSSVRGTIQPSMDLIEIVPLEDTLLVEARIKPADIVFLHLGQQAWSSSPPATSPTTAGGLDADLEHISADSITDKQDDDLYLVCLRTGQNYLGSKDKHLPIIPGHGPFGGQPHRQEDHLHLLAQACAACPAMALRER